MKGDTIDGITPIGVVYGARYEDRLKAAIFGEVGKFASQIAEYHHDILGIRDELAEVGILMRNNEWDLSGATAYQYWPKIRGKHMKSFPSRSFNLAFQIGDDQGVIHNPTEL